MDDVGSDLKAYLDYVAGRKSDHRFVKKLEEVNRAKQNREWRREFMTLLIRDQENIEKGIKQEIGQGENQYAKLPRKLLQEKRYDAIGRISEGKGYRQELYREYHIL